MMADNSSNNTGQLTQLTGLTEHLPGDIQGWKKSEKGKVYTPDNLFEYINGGAELYISYDFINLAARTYSKEGFPEIKIDIFDMSRSANAFGVFTHSREKVDDFIAPDVESEYAGGLLTFWKGKYYVSILAYPETEEKKNLVQQVGRAIAAGIKDKSVKPPLIDQLPKENLDTESIRYFRHYIWLNSYYFISGKNILNMDKETEAVIAKYQPGKKGEKPALLLLVTYPDAAKAKAACKTFVKNYIPDAKEGFQQIKNGRWAGCVLAGSRVNIVLNAPGLEPAKALLAKIK
jgi:hypothetical protein